MLQTVKILGEYAIQSRKGDIGIGQIWAFLFSEDTWHIHAMVIDMGEGIESPYVLISSDTLGRLDHKSQRLTVTVTQQEIQDSPEVQRPQLSSLEERVAVQADDRCHIYRSSDPSVLKSVAQPCDNVPIPEAPLAGVALTGAALQMAEEQSQGVSLRGTRDVIGCLVVASDGDIGHVEDVVIDTVTWHISHLVITTQDGWPVDPVMIAPSWIHQMNWDTMHMMVHLPCQRLMDDSEFHAVEGML